MKKILSQINIGLWILGYFNNIHEINSIDDIYAQYGDTTYKLDKENLITVFALNVILVLEGIRLAYRTDDNLPNFL